MSRPDRSPARPGEVGQFAYEGLERVMHERARLGILCCLASATDPLTFSDLKQLCQLTDGNLSRHLHALEEADIIRLERQTGRGRPTTTVAFTTNGRERFLDYMDLLESIVTESCEALRARRTGDVVPLAEGGVG